MENRPTFKEFYTQEKHLFEIVAFFGVVGGLLLQVQNPPKELRIVQAVFHLFFLLVLAWTGWRFLQFILIATKKEKETLLDIIQSTWISQILIAIIATITISYFNYVYTSFKDELWSVYQKISVYLYLIFIIQFSKIQKFLEPHLGKKHAEMAGNVYLCGSIFYAGYWLLLVTRKIIQEPLSYLLELCALSIFASAILFLSQSFLLIYFPSLQKKWVSLFSFLFLALTSFIYLYFSDCALICTSWPMCHY